MQFGAFLTKRPYKLHSPQYQKLFTDTIERPYRYRYEYQVELYTPPVSALRSELRARSARVAHNNKKMLLNYYQK